MNQISLFSQPVYPDIIISNMKLVHKKYLRLINHAAVLANENNFYATGETNIYKIGTWEHEAWEIGKVFCGPLRR